MKKPKVSFVIRTLNEALWIGKVLKTLLQQDFNNFEIIVIDSGSKDKTVEIVKRFPVKLIQIKPEEFHYSYALNLGISKAKGDYIAIISGHSIPISDDWLSKGLENFKDKKVAAVSGHYSSIPIGYISRRLGRLFFAAYQKRRKEKSANMTNTNSLIRKDLWKQYPFDEEFSGCEDYDWASEMLARGYKIIIDPNFSVFHSHFLLGKPGYLERKPRWKKTTVAMDKRKRPRKSYIKTKF